jgi:hypothetical protein
MRTIFRGQFDRSGRPQRAPSHEDRMSLRQASHDADASMCFLRSKNRSHGGS